jgi:hypothetical protein
LIIFLGFFSRPVYCVPTAHSSASELSIHDSPFVFFLTENIRVPLIVQSQTQTKHTQELSGLHYVYFGIWLLYVFIFLASHFRL